MARNLLNSINENNWEGLAAEIAKIVFPIGSFLDGVSVSDHLFGRVASISASGKITVQLGEFPKEKVTDNENTGGTYGKFWYNADEKLFVPIKKGFGFYKSLRAIFSPSCYQPEWKRERYDSPIMWSKIENNCYLTISKLRKNEKGLVMVESSSD